MKRFNNLIGKSVFLILKNGERFAAKLVDVSNGNCLLELNNRRFRVRRDMIKKYSPYRKTIFEWVSPGYSFRYDEPKISFKAAAKNPELCPVLFIVDNPNFTDERTIDPFRYAVLKAAGTIDERRYLQELCAKPLTAEGKCEVHGEVRFDPRRKSAEDEKENKKESKKRRVNKNLKNFLASTRKRRYFRIK